MSHTILLNIISWVISWYTWISARQINSTWVNRLWYWLWISLGVDRLVHSTKFSLSTFSNTIECFWFFRYRIDIECWGGKSIQNFLPNQTMICGNILLCKTAIYYFKPASCLVMIFKSVFMSCRQSERVNVCTLYCEMKTA